MIKSKMFPSPSEVARQQFRKNLERFLEACPGWSRATLLEAAGMDLGLIRRVEGGQSFQVGSLDKLQLVMDKIVLGKVRLPGSKPRQPTRKGEVHERHAG